MQSSKGKTMCTRAKLYAVVLCLAFHSTSSLSSLKHHSNQKHEPSMPRRRILSYIPYLVGGFALGGDVNALDIDSFIKSELETTSGETTRLSDDEALCKFGQPSQQRGDACVRAGLPTTLKKGGVDAFGRVDRGTYTRCEVRYVEDKSNPSSGMLVKERTCN